MHRDPAETDENGDTFEQWLVGRSYALLHPVCAMGWWVVVLMLVIADPAFHAGQLWPDTVPLVYLVLFHAATFCFLGGMWLLTRGAHAYASRSHQRRRLALTGFVCIASVLCIWFGIVSWLGFGDLSVVAVTNVMMAAMFPLPGLLRRVAYAAQACLLSAGILASDPAGHFLGQLQFINVLVIFGVSYAIDRYMMRNARQLFDQKCAAARARARVDEVLYNALPADIVRELQAHQRVQPRLHPGMAVLFADLAGFTAFAAARSPEDVVRFLNRLFYLFDAQSEIHGVQKIKTIGDAYMAVHPNHPAALAHFALALLPCLEQANREMGQHLQLRIGMHCGPSVAGVIGAKRFLYDVWGDAVNLASRMESSSLPGRIQVTATVQQSLQDQFAFGYRGLLPIEGKGLVHTYFLLGHAQGAC